MSPGITGSDNILYAKVQPQSWGLQVAISPKLGFWVLPDFKLLLHSLTGTYFNLEVISSELDSSQNCLHDEGLVDLIHFFRVFLACELKSWSPAMVAMPEDATFFNIQFGNCYWLYYLFCCLATSRWCCWSYPGDPVVLELQRHHNLVLIITDQFMS